MNDQTVLDVTVAVPVLNEAATIEPLVRSLVHQTYPAEHLEIVVADGGSADGTREWLDAAARRHRAPRLRVVHNPHRVTAGGLNTAIESTTGDVVILVGGHSEVPPDFVERSVAALLESGADVAGGQIDTRGRTRNGRAIAAALRSPFGVGANAFRVGRSTPGWVDTVPFGAYRREVFDRVGLFDLTMVGAEDGELNFRIRRHGGRIWYDPTIRSVYYCRDRYRDLARQYWRYGRGKGWILRRSRAIPSVRQVVPALLLLTLAGGVLTSLGRRSLAPTAVTALPYLGAAAWAAVTAARNHGVDTAAVAAAFVTIHLSYGAGFLAGTIRPR